MQASHPVWVRGLKLLSPDGHYCRLKSHPVWVRGLKHIAHILCLVPVQVAPCVGAWIETSMITMQGTTQNVAPCVVRGLKLRQQTTPSSSRRCPCVGAWIETSRMHTNKKGKRTWKVRLPFTKSLIIDD